MCSGSDCDCLSIWWTQVLELTKKMGARSCDCHSQHRNCSMDGLIICLPGNLSAVYKAWTSLGLWSHFYSQCNYQVRYIGSQQLTKLRNFHISPNNGFQSFEVLITRPKTLAARQIFYLIFCLPKKWHAVSKHAGTELASFTALCPGEMKIDSAYRSMLKICYTWKRISPSVWTWCVLWRLMPALSWTNKKLNVLSTLRHVHEFHA